MILETENKELLRAIIRMIRGEDVKDVYYYEEA